jgi:hypothetical protein
LFPLHKYLPNNPQADHTSQSTMVSKKALKIGAAGIAVSAVAIGLGVGLSKKNTENRSTSASQATMCRRLIDGRYASPTNDIFEKNLRDLQWGRDGHSTAAAASGGSKSGSKGASVAGVSKGSKGGSSKGFKAGSAKGFKGSSYKGGKGKGYLYPSASPSVSSQPSVSAEPSSSPSVSSQPSRSAMPSFSGKGYKGGSYKAAKAKGYKGGSYKAAKAKGANFSATCSTGKGSMQYDMCEAMVPCDCISSVAGSAEGSKGGSYNFAGSAKGGSAKGASFAKAGSAKGASFAKAGVAAAGGWGSDGHMAAAAGSAKGGSAKAGSAAAAEGSSKGASTSGSKGGSANVSGAGSWRSDGFDRDLQWGSDGHTVTASGGSKSGGSSKGGSVSGFAKAGSAKGSKGGSVSGFAKAGSAKGSKGGSVSGFAKAGSAKGSKGSSVSGAVCSCPASTVTGYAPTGSAGMIPMAPTICNIAPVPPPTTIVPLVPPTIQNVVPPTTSAPTPCNAQRFFLVNGVCTNDIFMMGATSYGSAMECCNINMGSGSMLSGTCSYVDTCNPEPLTTPPPTPCEGIPFYYSGGMCSNSGTVISGATGPFTTAEQCCDMNFGTGSMYIATFDGGCNYDDSCNPPPPVSSLVTPPPTLMPPEPTPAPSSFEMLTVNPTSGSTPTVSTEVTGPPTVAGRGN